MSKVQLEQEAQRESKKAQIFGRGQKLEAPIATNKQQGVKSNKRAWDDE